MSSENYKGADWEDYILGYDEECLLPHMKILIFKWDSIEKSMQKQGQVDKEGFVWTSLAYLAKCCGCHFQTMQRTLKLMGNAKYIEKVYKNGGTAKQQIGLRMCKCVYDAEFDVLPTTRKGKGQRKYICYSCGSRNVETQATYMKITCQDCGAVHHTDSKGKRIS